MFTITDRQRRVLDAVTALSQRLGYPPTLRELGTELGIRSTNGVADHLRALERKGFVVRGGAGHARTIRVVQP